MRRFKFSPQTLENFQSSSRYGQREIWGVHGSDMGREIGGPRCLQCLQGVKNPTKFHEFFFVSVLNINHHETLRFDRFSGSVVPCHQNGDMAVTWVYMGGDMAQAMAKSQFAGPKTHPKIENFRPKILWWCFLYINSTKIVFPVILEVGWLRSKKVGPGLDLVDLSLDLYHPMFPTSIIWAHSDNFMARKISFLFWTHILWLQNMVMTHATFWPEINGRTYWA